MTERELQDAVIRLARLLGWLVHHDRPAQTGKGWRTPVQGDTGFPDLVLAKDGEVLFVELKVGGRKPSAAQQAWLGAVGGMVWTDKDWRSGYVEWVLRGNQ